MAPPKPRRPKSRGVNIPLPGMPDPPQTGQPSSTPKAGASSDDGRPRAETLTQDFRESLFGALTGRQVRGAGSGDLRSQLIAAFGSSSRDPSRPDTAAAAKGLKVSQRSVQRWLKTNGGLSKQHDQALKRRARQAMTTKRGRERALAAAQRSGAGMRPTGRAGRGLRVGGVQGVTSDLEGDYRDRDTAVVVTDEDLTGLQSAWTEGGDVGAAAWLHNHWDTHYVGGWHFKSIDDVSWSDTKNY